MNVFADKNEGVFQQDGTPQQEDVITVEETERCGRIFEGDLEVDFRFIGQKVLDVPGFQSQIEVVVAYLALLQVMQQVLNDWNYYF